MFPINNRPPEQPRRMQDPFSIRPNRPNMYPVPKSKASLPSSIASYLDPNNGKLTKTLSNVQQVMNMVESAAPMIKEYGPMVKNLPMMLKMMKALNEPDEIEEDTNNGNKTNRVGDEQESVEISSDKRTKSKTSSPKLFI